MVRLVAVRRPWDGIMGDIYGAAPEDDCDLFIEIDGQRFSIDWHDGIRSLDQYRRRAAAIVHENAPDSGFDAFSAKFEFCRK